MRLSQKEFWIFPSPELIKNLVHSIAPKYFFLVVKI